VSTRGKHFSDEGEGGEPAARRTKARPLITPLAAAEGRRHQRFAATFACWWLLFSALGVLWALATPIGASPDSPSQVARAASVVRGQWVGPAVPGPTSNVSTSVRVPQTYAFSGAIVHCYMFKENVSAACASPPEQSSRTVMATTHVGRYLPAYYLAVGWPSLITTSVTGVYLMQAASAVLCAMFLALAVATARQWSRSALLVPAIFRGRYTDGLIFEQFRQPRAASRWRPRQPLGRRRPCLSPTTWNLPPPPWWLSWASRWEQWSGRAQRHWSGHW